MLTRARTNTRDGCTLYYHLYFSVRDAEHTFSDVSKYKQPVRPTQGKKVAHARTHTHTFARLVMFPLGTRTLQTRRICVCGQ